MKEKDSDDESDDIINNNNIIPNNSNNNNINLNIEDKNLDSNSNDINIKNNNLEFNINNNTNLNKEDNNLNSNINNINLNIEDNNLDTNYNNNKDLPLLSEKITINEEKNNIKPPIYQNELFTNKNYDEININNFTDNINNLLVKIKELIFLIENSFSRKNENLFKIINKYNIHYADFFYSLTFMSKELIIINKLIEYKYSENKTNINEYNKLKEKLNLESNFKDINEYINAIKKKNNLVYDLINEEQEKLLKNHILELIQLEKIMFNYYDKIEFIPGLIPITICFNCIEMNVSDTRKSYNEMIDSKYEKEHLIMLFLDNLSKLNILAYFINIISYSFTFEDVLNQKENDSGIWRCIKQHYIKYSPYQRDIIEKGLNKFLDYVNIGYASISKSKSKLNNKFKMYTSFGMYSTLYFFNKKKALTESKNFLMKPDLDALLTVWNMLDNPLFYQFVKIVLPSIKFKQSFYIKRTQKEIDIKLIEELCQKTKNFNPFNEEENTNIQKLFSGDNNENKLNENIPLIKEKEKEGKTNDYYVKIRVYNFEKLKFNSKIINESDIQKNINNNIIKEEKTKKIEKKRTIMIHVHGGGFVAMSPKSHENYTLKWANSLKIPIFSINYRLSPGVAFPKSLDDVYQSYIWIIKYSKIIFNIDFDEIIMAGDSAGGNLILSLTYLLIMNKIKLPKVIFLFYPALKIDINTIVPSYLNAITDIILEYRLLKFCIDSYSGKYTDNGKIITDTRNKFLSPIFMDDNILKLLPPIRIFGGTCDVLRDDTFYLMEKLLKLNKDVFFSEFKYFPHGFLNYDIKNFFPECALITDTITKEIEKYVE